MSEASKDGLEPFSFVLSSCNLSVVSINNFLALLAATAGTSLANSSLDLPVDRWKAPWLRTLLRWPLKGGLWLIAWAVIWSTRIKQPGQPYIRSPFLKLSAVFDAWLVEVHPPTAAEGSDEAERLPFLAVGEHVQSSSGAIGVVASQLVEERPVQQTEATGVHWPPINAILFVRHLVLTQVEGILKAGESVLSGGRVRVRHQRRALGNIKRVAPARPWYSRPSFFLHAGDQIYYDFPSPDRPPSRRSIASPTVKRGLRIRRCGTCWHTGLTT